MRKFILSLFTFIVLMTGLASAEQNPLASFRWDYRIILVEAPAPDVEDIVSTLVKAHEAIDERHILWFVIGSESVATNYNEPLAKDFEAEILKYYFDDASGETEVRLIGKDGAVKEKAKKLDLEHLYKRIDSMPMRQAEMRKR